MAPAKDRDECGKRINTLLKNIQKFEIITGTIAFIPSSDSPFPEDNI